MVQSKPAKQLDELSLARWLLTRILIDTVLPASNLREGALLKKYNIVVGKARWSKNDWFIIQVVHIGKMLS